MAKKEKMVMFKWGEIEIYVQEKDAEEFRKRMIMLGKSSVKLASN